MRIPFVVLPADSTPFNVAGFGLNSVACPRLRGHSRYSGSFGGDHLGTLTRQSLIDEGLDLAASRTVQGATNQLGMILVDSRLGERTASGTVAPP